MPKLDAPTREAMKRAVKADSAPQLQLLLAAGVSANQRIDENRTTLLEFAVEENAVEIVKLLIGTGADLNKGENKPLIHAALFNRKEIVELLLEAGADPNVTHSNPDEDQRGLTALMYAVDRPEKFEILDRLLKQGANPHLATNKGNTALGDAIDYSNSRAIARLLEEGCRPQGAVWFGAIYMANAELVKTLVAAKAEVQALGDRDSHFLGCTPLEAAVGSHAEKIDLIRGLQKHPQAAQPLEQATLARWRDEEQRFLQIIQELIPPTMAANPALLSHPLFAAAIAGDITAVQLLLKAGADPNLAMGRRPFERSALNAARAGGFNEVAQALIAAGAK